MPYIGTEYRPKVGDDASPTVGVFPILLQGSSLGVNLDGRRLSQCSEPISQSALFRFVESKFVFFDLAHAFGDIVQEDIRLNFQNFLGAGDLADRCQDPLDVVSLGRGSVQHVLDELVIAKFVRGGAQGTGKLRSLLVRKASEEGERRPLVFGNEGHCCPSAGLTRWCGRADDIDRSECTSIPVRRRSPRVRRRFQLDCRPRELSAHGLSGEPTPRRRPRQLRTLSVRPASLVCLLPGGRCGG